MTIVRQTLRSQIRDEILRRLEDGIYASGDPINEVALASNLGVSRTPLREALIGLETEGQIESEIGKGFRFAVLSAAEFLELGPIIATLECLALDLTDPADLIRLAPQLLAMAADFSADLATLQEVTARDEQWHHLLLSACPNQRLLGLVSSLKRAGHRYEFEVVDAHAIIRRSAAEHEAIAKSLLADDLAGAKQALRTNWQHGFERIVAQSTGNEPPTYD